MYQHFIITHGGCLDGLTAAYFRQQTGHRSDDIKFPVDPDNVYYLYHSPNQLESILELGWVEKVKQDETFILEFTDCCPTKENIIYLLTHYPNMRLAILDHHKTAEFLSTKGTFLERGSEFYDFLMDNLHRLAWIIDTEDSKRSATMMAYREVLGINEVAFGYITDIQDKLFYKDYPEWPTSGEEYFVRMVSDRDVWTHTNPNTKYLTLAIFSELDIRNKTLTYRDQMLSLGVILRKFEKPDNIETYTYIGRALHNKFMQDVKILANSKEKAIVEMEGKEHRGYLVNAPAIFSSDLGNYILENDDIAEFVIVYSIDKSGVKCSIRSKSTFDSSALAKRRGGGGHTQAAGFSLPEDSGHFELVDDLYLNYLHDW